MMVLLRPQIMLEAWFEGEENCSMELEVGRKTPVDQYLTQSIMQSSHMTTMCHALNAPHALNMWLGRY